MTEAERHNRTAMRNNILERVRYGQPHTATVVMAIQDIFAIDDRYRRKLTEIQNDVKLSPKGREAEISNFVRKDLMPNLAKVTRPLRKVKSHTQSKRATLEDPIEVDHKDFTGELRRQEVRTYLRGLSGPERMSAANQLVQDDAGAAAILDAAPTLSGLDVNFYGELRKSVADRINGPKLQELAAVEADFQQGDAAAGILLNDLVRSSGLTPKAFAEEMQPHEAAADA